MGLRPWQGNISNLWETKLYEIELQGSAPLLILLHVYLIGEQFEKKTHLLDIIENADTKFIASVYMYTNE